MTKMSDSCRSKLDGENLAGVALCKTRSNHINKIKIVVIEIFSYMFMT